MENSKNNKISDGFHEIQAWLRKRQPFELTALVSVVLIVLGIWGFITIAGEVMEGDYQHLDEQVVNALRDPEDPSKPIGPPWVLSMVRDITALGGYTLLILITLTVLGFLALQRRYGAFWLVLFSTLSGFWLNSLLKNFFERERPSLPHLTMVSSASFPSGHAMTSAIIYLTLGALLSRVEGGRKLKIYIFIVAITITLLVGLSRIYLGVHYPTDVLAGWTAGGVWALICLLIAGYLQRLGVVKKSNEE